MMSPKLRGQFIEAVLKAFELLARNPEMIILGRDYPETRPMVAGIFMRIASLKSPDLDEELLANAFAQAMENYMEHTERQENEKRAKENEKWDSSKNGPPNSSVH
jgi:hypothetical protein